MWKTVRLGDVCDFQNGYAFKSKDYSNNGYFVMRISNVQQGYISTKNPKYIEIEQGSKLECFALNIGDILVSLTGNVGRVGVIYEEHLPCALNQRVARLTKLDAARLNKDFLFHYLNSSIFRSQVEGLALGAAQGNVSTKNILKLSLSLPPLSEQQRIVAEMDAAFAEIDRAIEAVEDINQNLGAIFEKILDASTQQQAPSVKLRDVCDIQAKLISPKDEPYCNEPHIGAGNIVSMSNELVDVLLAKEEGLISGKFPFSTDSVLYSKIRPYLRKVHLPRHTGICSADMYPLIPDAKILDRKYLYYLLLSQNFTDYAMSGAARAGMPKVNRNHLFGFEFQLPALEVQRLIVKKMEAIRLESSNLQRIQNLKITQINALKSAILAQELQSEAA
ncbi:restriction endonuclease subunit S [Gammaproteobacteria bacterium]|nr:restriction endonuclease subunit S [Gammaproteobacteria bacterium]